MTYKAGFLNCIIEFRHCKQRARFHPSPSGLITYLATDINKLREVVVDYTASNMDVAALHKKC